MRKTGMVALLMLGLLGLFRGRDWSLSLCQQAQFIRLNETLAGSGETAFGLENGTARPQFPVRPAHADVLRQWGEFYASQQPPNWAEALSFYEMALQAGDFALPDGLFQVRLLRARAWRGVGRIDEAVAEWEALLRLRPQDYNVLLDLATTAWAELGEYAAAEAYYQQAITADPQPIWAYRGLGLLYEQQGRTDEALAMFAAVLNRQPDEPIALEHTDALLRK